MCSGTSMDVMSYTIHIHTLIPITSITREGLSACWQLAADTTIKTVPGRVYGLVVARYSTVLLSGWLEALGCCCRKDVVT